MRTAIVLGLGISGQAAKKLLEFQNWKVLEVDDHTPYDMHTPYELLVTSPGICPKHPVYQHTLNNQIPLISEIELGLQSLPTTSWVIGITGTNGKTTLTYYLEHFFASHGFQAKACGNCGLPLTSCPPQQVYVIELSSFQLERTFSTRLDAACILPIDPDHLNRYANFQEYQATKMRILSLLKPQGVAYVADSLTPPHIPQPIHPFSTQTLYQTIGKQLLTQMSPQTPYQGPRLDSFHKPPHRLEDLGLYRTRRYINDSKATNVASTLYALHASSNRTVLILGGQDKHLDFSPLTPLIQQKVCLMLLYGQAGPKIASQLSHLCPNHQRHTLQETLDLIDLYAPEHTTVLFSPGCASFDQFENFEARGAFFTQYVKKILE